MVKKRATLAVKRFFQNFALLVVSLVVAVIIIEVFLTYTMPIHVHNITSRKYQVSLNPNIAYELKPLVDDHNSDGIRSDRDYVEEKPDDVFRIVIAGDSLAFGLDVKLEETYAKLLEKKLNEQPNRNKHYEVINLGVPGYSITQIVERIKDKGLQYDPDYIIYGYWLDDITVSCTSHERILLGAAYDGVQNNKRLILTDGFYKQTFKNLLLKSQIIRRAISFYRGKQYEEVIKINSMSIPTSEDQFEETIQRNVNSEVSKLYIDYIKKLSGGFFHDEKGFESLYKYYANVRWFIIWNNKLEEFSRITGKKNIKSLLLMTPVIYNYKDKDYNWAYLHKFIQGVAKCYSIPYLDLQGQFAKKNANEVDSRDHEHPNALENELIAKHLYNYLISTGI